ncbi:MAG: hypothetical protein QNJ14_07790 [Woeseiaceae bacterium]|nr:hypothetical protein [Woeseiaceae bacterium]
MVKTFFIGIILGLAAAAGALYAFPAVDQAREASLIRVAPNGGNVEEFRINIPMDRIMVGAPDQPAPLPPGLSWPSHETLDGVRTELFKIRNARDSVVGVAVRNAASSDDGNVIDWVLHLPARGSVFVNMESVVREGGYRIGRFRSGSREFGSLNGFMTERWVANSEDRDEDAPLGRIELLATYVGELEPLDEEQEVVE